MPTVPAVRSAAAAAALVLTVTGCSLFDRDGGEDRSAPQASASPTPSSTPSPSPSPSESPAVSTVEQTCARAGEAAHDARDLLREDPARLLARIDDIAGTAPPELAGEIADIRDAVDGYRKGERSYLGVLREAKDLQERCTA